MPLLGRDGIVEFSREWPAPLALDPSALNVNNTITIQEPYFWNGDRVFVACANGVPVDFNDDGYADCPEGHGIYRGSIYALGPARDFYTGPETNEDGPHYQASDAVPYYNTEATTGFTTILDAYMSRDLLDRVKLWSSLTSSLNGTGSDGVLIRPVKIGNIVFARYDEDNTYRTAVINAAASIVNLELPETEQPLSTVISLPPIFATIADSPESRSWIIQAQLQNWALDLDASSLDMTAIGETFGENTKALVKGAGSLGFVLEHQGNTATFQDSLTLLRLVLLTQQGSKASAKFYLVKDKSAAVCQNSPSRNTLGGTIYYETDILLTNSRINLTADTYITGSTDFVATGLISLKISPAAP